MPTARLARVWLGADWFVAAEFDDFFGGMGPMVCVRAAGSTTSYEVAGNWGDCSAPGTGTGCLIAHVTIVIFVAQAMHSPTYQGMILKAVRHDAVAPIPAAATNTATVAVLENPTASSR